MKRFTRILVLLVIAALALSLCACGSDKKMELLTGTWSMATSNSEEQAMVLLEAIDLYEEEIAVVDKSAACIVKIVEFSSDKTYRFAYDVDATKVCVREFYIRVFEDLYENRASLASLYEEDITQLGEEDFYLFYAALYGVDSYDALMDKFTGNAYNYESLAENIETGTYKVVGDKILTTITGETEAESLGYKVEGNTLTLSYTNATEVYTKAAG